ncbi:MAG: hypothetical protein ACRD0U_13260 [Acidimicrobiales bacterium]
MGGSNRPGAGRTAPAALAVERQESPVAARLRAFGTPSGIEPRVVAR